VRPLDELVADAVKVASAGLDQLVIKRGELRMLKDYDMVVGTDNPNVARFCDNVTVTHNRERITAPTNLMLVVTE
jgi:hypothetical protein